MRSRAGGDRRGRTPLALALWVKLPWGGLQQRAACMDAGPGVIKDTVFAAGPDGDVLFQWSMKDAGINNGVSAVAPDGDL